MDFPCIIIQQGWDACADPEKLHQCGPDNVFLVINVFHRGPFRPPSRSNWIQRGPIVSRGVSVPEFLRKPIATCDFPRMLRTPWIRAWDSP